MLFGFRIYVECGPEQSDVRPVERGDPYVAETAVARAPVDNESAGYSTAYDRVDDRTFPDPSHVPVFDVENRSTGAILGTRSSRG